MKRRAFFLFFLLPLFVMGADVEWVFSDFTTTASGVRRVQITPIQAPWTNSSGFVVGDRKVYTNNAAGSLIISNMAAGSYRVDFIGPWTTTSITNSIPETTNFISAKDYVAASLSVPGSTVAYTRNQSDSLYWAKTGLVAGAQITFTTNAGVVSINSTAEGGTATNIIQSKAGTNIVMQTNGLLYTINGQPRVHVAPGANVTVTTNGALYTIASTAAASVSADTTNKVYVSSSMGTASGTRGDPNDPFQTISQGVGAAQSGDTVVILPGLYTDTVTMAANVRLYYEPGAVHTNTGRLFQCGANEVHIDGYGSLQSSNILAWTGSTSAHMNTIQASNILSLNRFAQSLAGRLTVKADYFFNGPGLVSTEGSGALTASATNAIITFDGPMFFNCQGDWNPGTVSETNTYVFNDVDMYFGGASILEDSGWVYVFINGGSLGAFPLGAGSLTDGFGDVHFSGTRVTNTFAMPAPVSGANHGWWYDDQIKKLLSTNTASTFGGTVFGSNVSGSVISATDATSAEGLEYYGESLTLDIGSSTWILTGNMAASSGTIYGNGAGLTNLNPIIATNNSSASDGMVLSRTGGSVKWVAAGGEGSGTTEYLAPGAHIVINSNAAPLYTIGVSNTAVVNGATNAINATNLYGGEIRTATAYGLTNVGNFRQSDGIVFVDENIVFQDGPVLRAEGSQVIQAALDITGSSLASFESASLHTETAWIHDDAVFGADVFITNGVLHLGPTSTVLSNNVNGTGTIIQDDVPVMRFTTASVQGLKALYGQGGALTNASGYYFATTNDVGNATNDLNTTLRDWVDAATNNLSRKEFNVKAYGATGDGLTDDTSAIEAAVSAAISAGGGVVYIPPGTFMVRRPLVLGSNVELRGSGGLSILKKFASVKSLLSTNLSFGQYAALVDDGSGFSVGDKIYIADSSDYEWSATEAQITNKSGNALYFDKALEQSYRTDRSGFISTSHPLVINSPMSSNMVVSGLVLDQNKNANDPNNAFTVATIHWVSAYDSLVENCVLRNAFGDAYSDQGIDGTGVTLTTNSIVRNRNTIQGCLIYGAGRHATHLGTALEGGRVINNRMVDCGSSSNGYALFYCAYATKTLASGNVVDNCYMGFAGLDERDIGNVISGNTVRGCVAWSVQGTGSTSYGILDSGGTVISGNHLFGRGISISIPNTVISGNTINMLTNPATAIIIPSSFGSGISIVGNSIIGNGTSGSKGIDLIDCDDVRLSANIVRGLQKAICVTGASRLVAAGNSIISPTSTAWDFQTRASTNVFITGDCCVFSTPVTETVAVKRLVYQGLGQNGTDDPATGGQWNGISGRMFDGVIVVWTNASTTKYSLFSTGNGWTSLSDPVYAQNATNLLGSIVTNNVGGAPAVGYVPKIQSNGAVNWGAESAVGAYTNHSDVTISSLTAGNHLAWSGTAWTNGPSAGGVGSQTPLTSDIDGAQYWFTNLATVKATNYFSDVPSLGTTIVGALQLTNSTAASVGAQQNSPALLLAGNGWKTTATAASQPISAGFYLKPVQGSTAPTAQMRWVYSINGAAFTDIGPYFTTGGNLTVDGTTTFGGPAVMNAGVRFNSRSTVALVTNAAGNLVTNWAPGSSVNFARVTCTNNTTISGCASQLSDGTRIIVANCSTNYTITFSAEDSTSSAEQRFSLSSNYVLNTNEVCELLYDAVGGPFGGGRWRILR